MIGGTLRGKVIGLIGFTLVCVAMFLYLFVSAGGRLRVHEPYNAKALIPDTFNIVPNSDIRQDGVKIGRVRTVEPQGSVSEVKFEIEDKAHQQLYRDATVKVRTKTLVGESYLQVEPGTPSSGKLKSGSVLPLQANIESVPLERILSTMDPKTRAEVRRNMEGLGGGLNGHGKDLNALFAAMKPAVASGGRLMDVLAPQKEELAGLVDNTGTVLHAFGDRQAALQGLVVDAKRTAEVVAARDAKLRESLNEIPATLDRAKSSVATLASFSGRATPTIRNLKTASADLAPAVRDLEPAARDARTLFRELEPFLAKVDPLLKELKPASKSLATMVRPLDALLRQASPALGYMAPHAADMTAFFSNVGAIVNARDAVGVKGRVFALAGESSITNLTPTQRKVLNDLIAAGGAQSLYNLRSNPYPGADQIGHEQPFDGSYTRVEEGK